MKTVYTSSIINKYAQAPQEFILECEAKYKASVNECAKNIFADPDKKIVMLAGPSSSGKTTTAKILSGIIEELGGTAYTVSLDNFYRSHDEEDFPLNKKGEQDYECVESLNISLIKKCLGELIDDNESILPVFDFTTGMRNDNVERIALDDNDIIIIEGIHALNPLITEGIDPKNIYRIYVSVETRIYDDYGDVLFSRTDLRFARRAVRDYYTRAMSIDRTIGIWQSVIDGEKKYLYPFEKYADFRINSFHPCEPCLLKEPLMKLLTSSEKEENSGFVLQLSSKLSSFGSIDRSLLPDDSLLTEFVINDYK